MTHIHTCKEELLAFFFVISTFVPTLLCPRVIYVFCVASKTRIKWRQSFVSLAGESPQVRSAYLLVPHGAPLSAATHQSRLQDRPKRVLTWVQPWDSVLLMPDTVGCLHRPQSHNTNHQPAWEWWLLQPHAAPIEFSEVWRRMWRKRCEGWWRSEIISPAEIRSFCSEMMCSAIWVLILVQELLIRPLWWSTGVSILNLMPQSFSTKKITSRRDWRLSFEPRPRCEQDDVNGPEHPTRAVKTHNPTLHYFRVPVTQIQDNDPTKASEAL